MLSKGSIEKLTKLLELPATGLEQDWEVELANASRVAEFVEAYELGSMDDADRFALMTLTLASIDRFIADEGRPPASWERVGALLTRDAELHRETVSYWACEGEDDPDSWFHLTPHVRKLG